EHVQAGGGSAGGGHASGGALSLLYHRTLGPVLVASMTEYQMIEISNQQAFGDYPHMTLTPRIEFVSDKTYTSLSDFKAEVTAKNEGREVLFDARGQMLTAGHQPPRSSEVRYHLLYRMSEAEVVISASVSQGATAPVRLIVPIVARSDEALEVTSASEVRITKPRGRLTVRAEGAAGFDDVPKERNFNLVPGFECVPLAVTMQPGREVRMRIAAAKG
ncbi:MAG TPA: hypothetical protein VF214_05000, partial [Edaphobacter sp.]